jgi:hypothetical protein
MSLHCISEGQGVKWWPLCRRIFTTGVCPINLSLFFLDTEKARCEEVCQK